MYEQEIDVLNKAYVKVSMNGWRQGKVKYWSNHSPRCILQTFDAIISEYARSGQKVLPVYFAVGNVEQVMREFIHDEDVKGLFTTIPGDPYTTSIIEWNDYKYRKVKDVLNLIDKCLSYYMSEQTREPEAVPTTE